MKAQERLDIIGFTAFVFDCVTRSRKEVALRSMSGTWNTGIIQLLIDGLVIDPSECECVSDLVAELAAHECGVFVGEVERQFSNIRETGCRFWRDNYVTSVTFRLCRPDISRRDQEIISDALLDSRLSQAKIIFDLRRVTQKASLCLPRSLFRHREVACMLSTVPDEPEEIQDFASVILGIRGRERDKAVTAIRTIDPAKLEFNFMIQNVEDALATAEMSRMARSRGASVTASFVCETERDLLATCSFTELELMQSDEVLAPRIAKKRLVNPKFFGRIDVEVGQTDSIKTVREHAREVFDDRESLWWLTRDKKPCCRICPNRFLCPPVSASEIRFPESCLLRGWS